MYLIRLTTYLLKKRLDLDTLCVMIVGFLFTSVFTMCARLIIAGVIRSGIASFSSFGLHHVAENTDVLNAVKSLSSLDDVHLISMTDYMKLFG